MRSHISCLGYVRVHKMCRAQKKKNFLQLITCMNPLAKPSRVGGQIKRLIFSYVLIEVIQQ